MEAREIGKTIVMRIDKSPDVHDKNKQVISRTAEGLMTNS